jgi:hypothetical protein
MRVEKLWFLCLLPRYLVSMRMRRGSSCVLHQSYDETYVRAPVWPPNSMKAIFQNFAIWIFRFCGVTHFGAMVWCCLVNGFR